MKEVFLKQLEKQKIIAIIRSDNYDIAYQTFKVLYECGYRLIEITTNLKEVYSLISRLKEEYQDQDLLIGIGSVYDLAMMDHVIAAQADFIVSPNYNKEVLLKANEAGILSCIGCFSPSEMVAAYQNGATIIKVFPAHILTKDYIKAILAPLPFLNIICVGGVNYDNILDWLSLDIKGVGLSSDIMHYANK
ncbi:MAG: bifunctional 4-hydroxy-2-oxoglutarate aldolase/2-dehydro-3-deoxy-phosphogluconate aldolase, partial [Bacilli bacterium]